MADLISRVGPMLFGLFLIVLGGSFSYKFFMASVLGRLTYWRGFLPLTIISPWFTHLPPGKRTLVKHTQGLWVHILMGPIFLICAALCFSAGADYIGLPGTETMNYILNGGNITRPTCVTFDKTHFRFGFPLLVRSGTILGKKIDKFQIDEKEDQKLLHDNNHSYSEQQH